jgi:hypothetical protein
MMNFNELAGAESRPAHLREEDLITGEQLTSGCESEVNEIDYMVSVTNTAINTLDAISRNIEADRAGIESGNVSPAFVMLSTTSFNTLIELGIGEDPIVNIGTESASADTVGQLEIGLTSKVGLERSLVTNIKAVIAKIILAIKKVFASVKTTLASVKKASNTLLTKANELEDGATFEVSSEDNTKLNSLAGAYKDENINLIINKINTSNKLLTTSTVGDFSDVLKEMETDEKAAIAAAKAKSPVVQGISDVVFAESISTKKGTTSVYVTIKDGKASVGVSEVKTSEDEVTIKDLTKADIISAATRLVKMVEDFDIKDYNKKTFDELDKLNKAVADSDVEDRKTTSKYVTKFATYLSKVATKKISILIENQRVCYDLVLQSVKNAKV